MKLEEAQKLSRASQWQLIWWRFLRHKLAVAALIVLIVFYILTIFAEFFSPYDPRKHDIQYMYAPPSRIHFVDENGVWRIRPFVYKAKSTFDPEAFRRIWEEDRSEKYSLSLFVKGDQYKLWGMFESRLHLFGAQGGPVFLLGTDKMGRDLLSRILTGGRVSLSIGLLGVGITFILGIIIGGISGYYGGIADTIIQRIIEFIRSIPVLPLWMGLSAALPRYWSITQVYFAIVLILAMVQWTRLARVVRGKFMSVREEDFVMAARLRGAGEIRVLFKELLPSFYSYIIASLTLQVPRMILGETSLSFIGLGLQAPAISWGVLLKEAQSIRVLANSAWLLIPGVFIVIAILAFNFVGDGLRDAADPYASI